MFPFVALLWLILHFNICICITGRLPKYSVASVEPGPRQSVVEEIFGMIRVVNLFNAQDYEIQRCAIKVSLFYIFFPLLQFVINLEILHPSFTQNTHAHLHPFIAPYLDIWYARALCLAVG